MPSDHVLREDPSEDAPVIAPLRAPVWLVMTVILVAELSAVMCLTMPVPAIPAWLKLYGSLISVGWIMTSFLLVSAAVAAICGRLGDMFGRQRVLQSVLAILLVGCLVSIASTSLPMLILGRCLQGTSGAVLPLVFALTRQIFPPQRMSFGFGLVMTATAAGAAFAFPLAGFITDRFGPSNIFWIPAAAAAVGIAGLASVFGPVERRLDHPRIDWVGGILFAPAVALVLMAMSAHRGGGAMVAWTWPMGIAGIVLAIIWYWHERRHPAPMIDIRLFSTPYCLLGLSMMALIGLGAMQTPEMLSLFLQQPMWTGVGLGLTATVTGALKLPMMASGSFAALLTGWLADRVGVWPCVLAGALMMALSGFGLILWHTSLASIFVLIAAMIFGLNMVYVTVPVLLSLGTPESRASETMGVMSVVRSVVLGVGAQLLAIVLASRTVGTANAAVHYPAEASYETVFAYMGTIGLVIAGGALLCWRSSFAGNKVAKARPAVGQRA